MHTGADLVEQLIARLRDAGIATDAESLADALWLSERMTPPPPDAVSRPAPPLTADPRAPAGRPAAYLTPRPAPVPARSDILEPLPLERALRPLRHYQPRVPARQGELDETATAETSARSGQITPVFQQVRHREAQLLLMMDDSASMVVWDAMLAELRQVCEQVGAFRDVAVHYLRPRADGEAGVSAAPSGLAPATSADRLRDPTGRTVLLLLSDCCGALWRHGAAQRLLHRFSRTGPAAVLQPLPQRMWQRTLLPAEPGMLRSTEGPGGRLEFVPRRRHHGPAAEDCAAVPVLAPTRAALGAWARAVSGHRRAALDAAAVWVRGDHPGGPPPALPAVSGDPERLVADFQAVSSPAAHHLAVHLSAAPLAYPVMRLVQQAMMPQTGPAEMAEILLGELLTRADDRAPVVPAQRPPGRAADPPPGRTGPWYAFAPGVRDVLLRRLGLGEASLVLKHCALYVDRVYGPRARNVPALVLGHLSGTLPGAAVPPPGAPTGPGVPHAFAEAARGVLRRFQPGGVTPEAGDTPRVVIAHPGRVTAGARRRLELFRERGTIGDLWEAIRLLRTAPGDPSAPARSVPARTLLAECLLALWEVRREDDLLAEAHATARSAAAGADRARAAGDPELSGEAAGRAHLVCGHVLFAIAGTQDHTLPPERALAGAAAHLNRAARLSHAAPEQALSARMALVDLARARYDRTGDRAALRDARERLDSALAARPPGAPVPPAVLAARGALLAALAEDALRRNAPDRAREPALAAVADLAAVAAHPPGTFPGRHAAALLALAAARALATGDPGAPEVVDDLHRALSAADPAAARLLPPGRRASGAPPTPRDGLAAAGPLASCDPLAPAGRSAAGARLPSGAPVRVGLDAGSRDRCLRRLGRAHAARFARGGDVGELAAADRALALAQQLSPVGDPERAALLAERGELLAAWTAHGGGAGTATEAVRVVREALAQTPDGDPELTRRRLLFASALRLRWAAGGGSADLHEAEWTLHRAARTSPDSVSAAQAWLERGEVLRDLLRDADAAESLRRAAGAAEEARLWLLAARARHQLGAILQRCGDRSGALSAFRTAQTLWWRGGVVRGPDAAATDDRLRRLAGGW